MNEYRQVLAELAYAAEYEAVQLGPSPALRAALDAAWEALGEDARDAAHLRRGCGNCRGRLETAQDDLCRRCAAEWEPVRAALVRAQPVVGEEPVMRRASVQGRRP